MQRLGVLAKTYAIDMVIVALVVVGMLDTVLRWNTADPNPSGTFWFALPAMAVLAIVILAHRRFPFAGPAAYWSSRPASRSSIRCCSRPPRASSPWVW